MEALTPREIQTRIRSGQSLADVAKIAGLSAERVEAFAAPILAERSHIAALALASPVRRAGEPGSSRGLRRMVADRLLARGLDVDLVDWDAWRRADSRWVAEARYQLDGVDHVARFLFDHQGRFSVAADDEARWLIGDPGPKRRPPQGDDSEPTVDLVPPPPATAAADPTPAYWPPTVPAAGPPPAAWPTAADQPSPRPWPPTAEAADPAWAALEDDLGTEADSLAPGRRSDLDALYDMISVIEEDSVKIYRGLREPLPGLEADSKPPDQLAQLDQLIPPPPDPTQETGSATPARRRGGKRSRASVPSWDEIMFGGPPQAG
ncbi:MAG: DUF3071 domain-containing protein [Propionibacteriaceae bacterium]|jgi:hypothetical protein|nr:DUF3071 domain-containing protein [Propionibacteriaceae bacterium]